MSTFQPVIPRFLRCIADATFALSRPTVIVPFAAMSLVQLLLFAAYVFFVSPAFVYISPGVIALFGGEALLHYPDHLLVLPQAIVWIRTAAWIAVGFAVAGPSAARVLARLVKRAHIVAPASRAAAPGALTMFVAIVVYRGLYTAVHAAVVWAGTAPVLGRLAPIWNACDAVIGPLCTLAIAYAWVAGCGAPGRLRAVAAGLRLLAVDAAPSLLVGIAVAILAAPFDLMTSSVAAFVRAGEPGAAVFGAAAALAWDAPLRLILFASAISLAYGRKDGGW